MSLRFASLGSGSKGNGTLVASGGHCLLVDCGFTIKETERRMARLGVSPADLSAILVTHEHSDHLSGVAPLARKYKLPVYLTPGTLRARDIGVLPEVHLIEGHQPFAVADIQVTPVAVPHDAREAAQFVFRCRGSSLGLLTDLGTVTPHVESHFGACDALVLEANHDPRMLAQGPYPPSLKRRVGGAYGHLSNQQAAGFLERVGAEQLQHLVVAHISEKNNTLELAREALAEAADSVANCLFACQQRGFDWLQVEPD
ncbi:MBL fold metallo-hydrolase [Microbulbifer thermotolerans]|uniref:MBL fold metallo-hydrolase n=1 Tax=Microbulbifer thermotolerans TaxID=252514 RepID=A0A143HNE8_MICTH|nr:MBL fold metallo-hydrolase [Microbulbifer thermotolerans]AMX03239.1 MBL fold metallo-hydrolase [Microbulbifer thermotolerans]MCX2780901.1 MBL fold metallo-hydrolase [Microbulbifer thermotolerans]MCX2784245.1 MBL fold metallo-hydrolase [Microbulbifer thermotolerans]MCX2794322.1 MBL fold metallo-hydrolase [Microbulbifer thermotolerans]MCX2800970.1 MBL fold metallo-hydrolase [Microbulbifer thermotolerans]